MILSIPCKEHRVEIFVKRIGDGGGEAVNLNSPSGSGGQCDFIILYEVL